jgi:hypothetical protein
MTKKVEASALVILVAFALGSMTVASPAGQNAPISSGMGQEDTGAPRLALDEPLPGEKLIDKLKLDGKTQAPEVRLLLMDASREAAPLGQKMLELRQKLINLELQKKTDEIASAVEDYTAAAAEMAAIEARTFAKIYAILKPNQQANASQAFAIMAGIFQPAPPRGGGGRGGQRGGGQ